jgi:hypothetical protein
MTTTPLVDTPSTPDDNGAQTVGPDETTAPENLQGNQNISKLANTNLANADIPPTAKKFRPVGDSWKGDKRFFQTGKKAGQMRPSEAVAGADAEKARAGEFEGLKVESLKSSGTTTKEAEPQPEEKKRLTKAEKKIVEAKIGSKLVMRMLDTFTNWIAKGQYGAHFTAEQAAKRNEYRAELEQDWQDYLATLDIPMHPGLVVAFGSLNYVADAFHTPAGQARADGMKRAVFGKVLSSLNPFKREG